MATTMTASETMTDGQIETLVNQVRDAARKNRNMIPRGAAQNTLGVENLGMRMFSVFRNLVEAVSNLIIRPVKVDRSQKPRKALEATGRNVYCDEDVVKAMPHGEGEEAEVVFFTLGRYISDDDLEKEYELRGLKAADPYSLAAVNEQDPAFADEHPNGTHWKNAKGQWCYATFNRWGGGKRYVFVSVSDDGWYDYWWFAGLRK